MGNATAIRSFALSGGAAGSLVGAVLVVLVVLGAILAFNGDDRSAPATTAQSVAIQGAPEAAARSVRPATRAVARKAQPIPEPVATGGPTTIAAPSPPLAIDPPEALPPPVVIDPRTGDVPEPPPSPRDCVAGDLLPECVPPPPIPPPSDVIGQVSGGLDSTTHNLLGFDLGLQNVTAPLGQFLDDPLTGLEDATKRLRPGLKQRADRVAGGLNRTLTGVGGLLQGPGGNR